MSRIVYPFVDKAVVARNLRVAIELSKFSARQIAHQSDVQTSHLSRFLRTGAGISPDKIERIAEVIGADVRKLYSPAT